MGLSYEIDLASGKSDDLVATLSIDDVPETVTRDKLARHYEKRARLFMRHIPDPRVIAVRRASS